jgi:hypothetical protein
MSQNIFVKHDMGLDTRCLAKERGMEFFLTSCASPWDALETIEYQF